MGMETKRGGPRKKKKSSGTRQESTEKIGQTRDETVDAVTDELHYMLGKGEEFDGDAKKLTELSQQPAQPTAWQPS